MIRFVQILALILASPVAADIITPRAPGGGDVGRMARHVQAVADAGDIVRIDERCASSCTLQLLVGCVTPDARLGFHAPHVIEGPATAELWARLIAAHYPPQMAQWYLDGPAGRAWMTWIDGRQAVAMGATPC